jgi:hypothetical protein
MIAEALRAVLSDLPAASIEFVHRTGPRNAPARDWLSSIASSSLQTEGRSPVTLESVLVSADDFPVQLEVVRHGA